MARLSADAWEGIETRKLDKIKVDECRLWAKRSRVLSSITRFGSSATLSTCQAYQRSAHDHGADPSADCGPGGAEEPTARETTTRQRLLDRTREALDRIVGRKKKGSTEKLSAQVGKILDRYKMGKFVSWQIEDGRLKWHLEEARIEPIVHGVVNHEPGAGLHRTAKKTMSDTERERQVRNIGSLPMRL